jgi:hypothetical protein
MRQLDHEEGDVPHKQMVALEYANGRTHMCAVKTDRDLVRGAQFEKFGRVWRVNRIHRPPSKRPGELPYPVCLEVEDPTSVQAERGVSLTQETL